MTNNDEFDVDLELDGDAADTFADDAGFQDEAEQPAKQKKSGGGFLVKLLLVLILAAGGLFASVKYLGVQLPFDVPYLNELAGVEKPVPQQPAQPTTQDNAAVDLSTDTTMAGIEADTGTGAQPDGTGAALDWADDTMTSDTGMDAGNNVMVGDADASGITDMTGADADTTTPASVDDFGLPPTTDGATDLSTPDATADANAGWGDMPVEDQEAQDAAAAADPFGDVPMTDVPDTPVVTSPVPTTTTTVSVPAADNAAVAALEKKVATLETTLNDLKKTTATKSDVDALKASLAKIEKAVAGAPADTKLADIKTTTSEDVKPAPVKTTATKKAPVVRKSWVLRSAKPGMAWISEKGSAEIKTISVGDTVSGIGKVTAIAKDDGGRWVVNGTQGKINQ